MTLTDYVVANGGSLNGKKLTKPQLNLIAKLDAMNIQVNDGPTHLINQVNGFAIIADAVPAALVYWVYQVHRTYSPFTGKMHYGATKVAIGTFDRVRMFILNVYPQIYSNFID